MQFHALLEVFALELSLSGIFPVLSPGHAVLFPAASAGPKSLAFGEQLVFLPLCRRRLLSLSSLRPDPYLRRRPLSGRAVGTGQASGPDAPPPAAVWNAVSIQILGLCSLHAGAAPLRRRAVLYLSCPGAHPPRRYFLLPLHGGRISHRRLSGEPACGAQLPFVCPLSLLLSLPALRPHRPGGHPPSPIPGTPPFLL